MQHPDINPSMLKFARESMAFDLATAAKKLGIKDSKNQTAIEKLQSLELGQVDITYPILLKAVNHYKRPLIFFYLNSIPQEEKIGIDFRNFSNASPKKEEDEALLRALIRDIKLRQNLVCNVLEEDEAEPFSLSGYIDLNYSIQDAAAMIMNKMRIDIQEYRKAKDNMEAFKYLRDKIEAAGIFVLLIGNLGSHHTNIYAQTFRGIASDNNFAPFIIINDHDSKAAWSFTLLHELVHLLVGKSGISNNIISHDTYMPKDKTEEFCDNVAAEILLPAQEIISLSIIYSQGELLKLIYNIADEKRLSQAMIAYNLYKNNKIDFITWQNIDRILRERWLDNEDNTKIKNKKQQGGPNYYTVKRSKLGKGLLNLIKYAVNSGILQPTKAAMVLGVSPLSVHTLINEGA